MGYGGISLFQLLILLVIVAWLLFARKRASWRWLVVPAFAAASSAVISYWDYGDLDRELAGFSALSALGVYVLLKYVVAARIGPISFFPWAVLLHLLRYLFVLALYMAEEGGIDYGWVAEHLSDPQSYLSIYTSPRFLETIVLVLIIAYLLHTDSKQTGASAMQAEDVQGMVFIPRTEENIYSTLEVAKLEVAKLFEEIVRDLSGHDNLAVEFTHSLPYSGAFWVQLMILVSEDSAQRRLRLLITLNGHEFHRYPVEYILEFQDNDKSKRLPGIYSLDKAELTKVAQSLVAGQPLSQIKSRVYLPRFRTTWQLWLPKNKIEKLSNPWLAPKIFMIGGLVTLALGVGLILLLIGGVMAIAVWLQKKYIVTSGKPYSEPRNLKLVDSWQSVVFSLGGNADEIKAQLLAKLNESLTSGGTIREETIWYWGLDGKVERTQVAISNKRGIAFVHVYPYGDDLYVGWDAHINYGQWVEKDIATGRDKRTKKLVKLKSIESGWQPVNEYDVQDAISLGEWCHAQVVKVVKLAMKEHDIDQEIDFQILREARAGLTRQQQAKEEKKRLPGLGALKRLG